MKIIVVITKPIANAKIVFQYFKMFVWLSNNSKWTRGWGDSIAGKALPWKVTDPDSIPGTRQVPKSTTRRES